MTLQWRPPETPNGVITHYSIQLDENYSSNELMYTIEGLSPDTVYVLQLRAHTVVGAGPPSNITFLTCKQTMVVTWHVMGCLIYACMNSYYQY